jgi:hypothetical protein
LFNQLAQWAPDGRIRNHILVDNPAALYGFPKGERLALVRRQQLAERLRAPRSSCMSSHATILRLDDALELPLVARRRRTH